MAFSKIIAESMDLTDTYNFTGTLQQNGASIGETNTPMFKVSGGNLSIAHNTHTKLTISSEAIDTDNCFDLGSNNRFTPNKAGKYLFILQVQAPTGTDADYVNPYITKNGSSHIGCAGVQRDYNSVQFTRIAEANGSGDYFEAYAEQESGGNINLQVNEFSAFFIGT